MPVDEVDVQITANELIWSEWSISIPFEGI